MSQECSLARFEKLYRVSLTQNNTQRPIRARIEVVHLYHLIFIGFGVLANKTARFFLRQNFTQLENKNLCGLYVLVVHRLCFQ